MKLSNYAILPQNLQDCLPTLLRLNITPDVAGKVPLLPSWSYPESGKLKVSVYRSSYSSLRKFHKSYIIAIAIAIDIKMSSDIIQLS